MSSSNIAFNLRKFSKKALLRAYLFASSFLILIPAFYNGYPLFYSDSALYILVSHLLGRLQHAEDIPFLSGFGYAVFIRIVTWRATLYTVVIAQGLILSVLIYLCIKILLPVNKLIIHHFSLVLFLSLFTSMGWTTSQLMPDIFTSFLILSVFLLLDAKKKSWQQYLFLSIVIVFSILSHLTNITILFGVIFFTMVTFLFLKSSKQDRIVFYTKSGYLIALLIVSVLILREINNKYYHQRALSPTSSIFLMARLMDTGFMPQFLEEKCPEKHYEMCAYKDSLPKSYEGFLWDAGSVFNRTGGWNLEKHSDYKPIIRDVLTSPKYLLQFLLDCGNHSLKQIKTFQIGEGLDKSYDENSTPFQVVVRHFDSQEFKEDFLHSKQTKGELSFTLSNKLNNVSVIISLLAILWIIVRKWLNKSTLLFLFIVLSGIIVNAIATSSLSSVFNRFQTRVIWLLPLLAGILISQVFFSPERNEKQR